MTDHELDFCLKYKSWIAPGGTVYFMAEMSPEQLMEAITLSEDTRDPAKMSKLVKALKRHLPRNHPGRGGNTRAPG